ARGDDSEPDRPPREPVAEGPRPAAPGQAAPISKEPLAGEPPAVGESESRSSGPRRSFAERRAQERKAKVEEKILREKSLAERVRESFKHSQSVALHFLDEAGRLFSFIGQFFARFWRRPFEAREFVNQMDEVGSKSFLLCAITGLAIGIVLAMQSRGTLSRFGAEAVLPSMLALSLIKEIGPVITSLVLAGRLGSGFAAELGSMKVTEQIDAMEAAALKPFHYLVVTRVLACVIMFPVLTILVDVIGLAGGFAESNLSAGMDWRVFVDTAFSSLRFADVIVDTLKTSIFGFIVGSVACFLGYTVRGGTREVGQAAMQAVVLSSLLILIADVVVVRISLLLFGDISG
ncbi:MAG: ABC transporter permease, partial [Rhodothermales bacterium]|nr:ABC transporter permease [Rhodothermales bacterium]